MSIADPGAAIEAWLAAMPVATRGALRQALAAPRAWSVKRLANTAGVSPRQLVRHFYAAGCRASPKDVLLAARLAAAQALLRDPRPLSTVQLAHACGWVDIRSLRAALRRAGLPSVSALAHVAQGHATVSDLAARIGGY
jgi:transcriptional regulator GlxA family with amidase domain